MELSDALFQVIVTLADEVCDIPFLTHAACTTHSVDVIHNVLGEVKLNHMVHAHGIEASSRKISTNYDWDLVREELLKSRLSGVDSNVLVVGQVFDLCFVQGLTDLLHRLLGLGKYHDALMSLNLQRSLYNINQDV